MSRALHLPMSAGTLVLGLLLALVLVPGGEYAALGWLLAALGALGVAMWFLLPANRRS